MELGDRPHGWLRVLTQRTHLFPGLGVAAAAAALSLLVSQWLPSVSPLLLAIAAGAVLANTAGVAPSLRAGLAVAAKRWLRVGVALLGFQLALTDIAGLGWRMVVVVVGIVSGWHRPDPRTRPVAQGRAGPAPAHRVRLLHLRRGGRGCRGRGRGRGRGGGRLLGRPGRPLRHRDDSSRCSADSPGSASTRRGCGPEGPSTRSPRWSRRAAWSALAPSRPRWS